MPERHVSVPILRDVLLVALVAAIAFALGVAAAGYGAGGGTPDPASATGRGDISGSGVTRGVAFAGLSSPTTPFRHNRMRATVELPRADVSRATDPAPALPAERFAGDGAGRRETTIVQHPHNRRAYIMETASLLHRRGWIGLDERVAEATSGMAGGSDRSPVLRGPR